MRAALIGAVDFNASHFAQMSFDCVVAVDAGWQTCLDAGIEPDIVLGDFDSLGFVPDAAQVLAFSPIKDESDMEIALAHVLEAGADEVFIYGALSSRLDHTLANLILMLSSVSAGVKTTAIGDSFAVVALQGAQDTGSSSGLDTGTGTGIGAGTGISTGPDTASASGSDTQQLSRISFDAFELDAIAGPYAPFISTFAFNGDAHDVDILGFKYEVEHFTLPSSNSRGLSNEFTGVPATVSVGSGTVLVLFPLDALVYAQY